MKLNNIQALRACAALMIVTFHCGLATERLGAVTGDGRFFNPHTWWEGIPIFFAISGFIMVATTAQTFGSLPAAADFMRRRLVRIVPLYWLVTTVTLTTLAVSPALLAKASVDDPFYVIASYLFWPYARLNGEIRPLASMGWTLNLEMFFYVVFAVCLLFRRGVGFPVLFATLSLLVVARAAGILPGTALNFWGDGVVLGFLFGAGVGIAFNSGCRLSPVSAVCLAAIGFAATFLDWSSAFPIGSLSRSLAEAITAALILTAGALGPQIGDQWRAWRAALFIGDASYSLYLVSPFFLEFLYLLWLKGPLAKLPLWMFVPCGIVLALVAASLTFLLFEKPVTRRLSKRKSNVLPTLNIRLRFEPA